MFVFLEDDDADVCAFWIAALVADRDGAAVAAVVAVVVVVETDVDVVSTNALPGGGVVATGRHIGKVVLLLLSIALLSLSLGGGI